MIPKIIHYCWVGQNPLPEDVRKHIDSWKIHCPDYQIIEWNEDNFDINSNRYTAEAYAIGKWAFVSDYVRLYVLYKYGGVYMDTDVEVLNNLDKFLEHSAFSGFESNELIPTGIMGAEMGNPWIGHLLQYYENKSFFNNDGTQNLTPNTKTITHMTKEWDSSLTLNNRYQQLKSGLVLYPSDYFCPKSWLTGVINLTSNTCTIHHFAGSWLPDERKEMNEMKSNLINNHPYVMSVNSSKVGSLLINSWIVYRVSGLKYLFRISMKKLKISLMKVLR